MPPAQSPLTCFWLFPFLCFPEKGDCLPSVGIYFAFLAWSSYVRLLKHKFGCFDSLKYPIFPWLKIHGMRTQNAACFCLTTFQQRRTGFWLCSFRQLSCYVRAQSLDISKHKTLFRLDIAGTYRISIGYYVHLCISEKWAGSQRGTLIRLALNV